MLYRSNVAEFMRFGGKTATRNTRPGLRQTIELPEHGFQCHVSGSCALRVSATRRSTPCGAQVYVRGDGLAGVAIADKEYPARPVFSLLTRLLEDYEKEAGKAWRDAPKDCNDAPQFMKDQLKKYQNPQEVRWASLLARVSRFAAASLALALALALPSPLIAFSRTHAHAHALSRRHAGRQVDEDSEGSGRDQGDHAQEH
jgi:hypothetical protein